MDDWRIAVELALRLGTDFDLATVDEVTDELARVAPALEGVDCRAAAPGPRRRRAAAPRAPRRDRAAHARAVDPRRRRFGNLVGPDQGRRRSRRRRRAEGRAGADGRDRGRDAASRGRGAGRASRPRCGNGTARSPDVDVPARDAYALRLVVGRRLYDNGRMVSEAPVLDARAPAVPAAHQPARRGRPRRRVAAPRCSVTSTRGSQVVTVETDAGVPAGSRSSTSPPTARARPS